MSFINKWLRSDIKNIEAYQVPNAKNIIKMDAMESPFLIHKEIIDNYITSITNVDINRYPDPSAKELQENLKELMDIPKNLGILLGNGSDEIIQLLALACEKGQTIASFEPSFVMYQIISKLTHLKYQAIKLDDKFAIDIDKTLNIITKTKPKIIFIAYPNNPTGNSFNNEYIKKIASLYKDTLIVIDEAYYAYSKNSFLKEIEKFENMVIIRTVSKIGFAGIRLGLLIGNKETIMQLNKLRLPYNISSLTQASANILLKQKDAIKKNAQIIVKQRDIMFKKFNTIKGLEVYPSDANFLLIKTIAAKSLFTFLQGNGILIKNFNNSKRLKNYLRITIGSPQDNNKLLRHIEEFYD